MTCLDAIAASTDHNVEIKRINPFAAEIVSASAARASEMLHRVSGAYQFLYHQVCADPEHPLAKGVREFETLLAINPSEDNAERMYRAAINLAEELRKPQWEALSEASSEEFRMFRHLRRFASVAETAMQRSVRVVALEPAEQQYKSQ
jgi:hypothetical protein